ncbi:hypothetical protein DM860_012079 [Cuscuta australis]|uniref:Uncharacterized protein n=1 Tax=Cuscuta australis TaxID=267555 RepID=A0A328D9Y6_9ASTE|nr:hypothetical protein DM860_012079 [Cuscuta australis]
MAYRRRQQMHRTSASRDEFDSPRNPPPPPISIPGENSSSSSSASSSLAAKAIRASSAHRDFSLSSAYGESAVSSHRDSNPLRSPYHASSTKDTSNYVYTSMKSLDEPKQGFWSALARKAKSILDDDDADQLPHEAAEGTTARRTSDNTRGQRHEGQRKPENHEVQKGLDVLASSLNYISGTIGNAFEEGRAVVRNRTADILQETRKLQIRRKGSTGTSLQNEASNVIGTRKKPVMWNHMQNQPQTDLDTQLKASRDVAMAMAAKAKLLLRELKTVKADLAFAKERCAQLEEENRALRQSREKGGSPEDDDLIRLQLETLLAEKARLGQDNSVLTRENRFLREIVEYHQLTMQDVVYLDENSEEVTEVYPVKVARHLDTGDLSSHPLPFSELSDASDGGDTSCIPEPTKNVLGRHSKSFS